MNLSVSMCSLDFVWGKKCLFSSKGHLACLLHISVYNEDVYYT